MATFEAAEHDYKSFILIPILPPICREPRRAELCRARVLENAAFWRTCFPNDLFLPDDERPEPEQGRSSATADSEPWVRQRSPVKAGTGAGSR